jgi:hypothetical protein
MRKIRALALAAWTVGAPSALPQGPAIGEINFYGLRKLSQEHILGVLKLRPGDRLHGSKADMEDRLAGISGVVLARVTAICCEGPRVTLFIGLEQRVMGQRDTPPPAFRSEPAGNAVLPAELVEAYSGFLEAVARAAAQGRAREDLSAGYSMMDDPQAWAFQKRFLEMAPENAALLREVLRNGSEPSQRAIGAALIGYASNKQDTLDDLQYALQDPEEAVRANALRSLTALAVLSSKQPNLGLRISPTWMVELLNSVVLTDRVESVKVLTALTDGECPGKQAALELIRERALPAVLEMARWKTPGDALPPFLLAGRLAGMSYVDILQAWATGDREAVLARAAGTGRKKAGGTLQ